MTFNCRDTTLDLLLTRRSGKARDMIAPGPSADELHLILSAAMRVPDHGKLAPWRFVIVPSAHRAALADVMEAAYRVERPQAARTEIDAIRAYALQGETLLVVLYTPKTESHIPQWEQQLSVGAACQNLLLAAHALGFVGNWLTGWPAYNDTVCAALGGGPNDKVAAYVYLGSPAKELEERPRPDPQVVVRTWQPA
jgi:nitroreductase